MQRGRRSQRDRSADRRRHGWGRLAFATALTASLAATGCIPLPGTQPVPSAPTPSGCITDVGPADKLVVTGCGQNITYNVSVPAVCLEKRCGLIVDVHGWTMNGDIQESNTGIAAVGRQKGFIVVQPSSHDTSWGPLRHAAVADFMELAIDVWRVDPRRVHVTGFSLGGVMSWWFRCNRADLVASVAPTGFTGEPCTNGARPVPALYIQGYDDWAVTEEDVTATIDGMVATHGLGAGVVLDEAPGEWVHTRYSNGSGFIFETVRHHHRTAEENLAGHCIIGSLDPASIYGCDQPSTFVHGAEIVDFFLANPMR